jgi:hypothetical protein
VALRSHDAGEPTQQLATSSIRAAAATRARIMRRQQLWLTWKSERGDGGARDGSARRAATVERRTPAASVVALRVRVRVRARRPRVARPPRLMVAAGEHDAVVRTVSIWLGLLRVTPFFFFFFLRNAFTVLLLPVTGYYCHRFDATWQPPIDPAPVPFVPRGRSRQTQRAMAQVSRLRHYCGESSCVPPCRSSTSSRRRSIAQHTQPRAGSTTPPVRQTHGHTPYYTPPP